MTVRVCTPAIFKDIGLDKVSCWANIKVPPGCRPSTFSVALQLQALLQGVETVLTSSPPSPPTLLTLLDQGTHASCPHLLKHHRIHSQQLCACLFPPHTCRRSIHDKERVCVGVGVCGSVIMKEEM